MKKRLIALSCIVAIALCLCAVLLTPKVSAESDNFQVGWSRVDINPWVDPKDHSKGILQLPLRGNGNTMNRQSVASLIDDNGDGKVKTDGSDGLFATCIAITDNDGDTVLMMSVAIIGGFADMVDDARIGIVDALKKKGIDIPAENIQIQGTHTHNSIDLSQYDSSLKGSTTKYYLQDSNGNKTEKTITGATVYENFEIWYPYLISQLTQAGVDAVENRAEATMSKGEIDAGDAAGVAMNTVRHYTRVKKNTDEVYVYGSNFNSSGIEKEDFGDHSFENSQMNSGSAELAEANDTMHCLKFTFTNGNDPIALVNWRAHTTQNDRDGTRLNVSSCYVNRMSKVLSDNHYRSIFIQGAAGNVTPSSAIYGAWCDSTTHKDKDGDGIWEGNELSGNIYGEKLGQVAVKCLKENMSEVSAGDIKVTNMVFNSDAKSYEEEVMYYAGLTATEYYALESSSEPFAYPADVYTTYVGGYSFMGVNFGGDYLYNLISKELQEKADEFKNSGESYVIASRFHASHIPGDYQATGTEDVDLTAFMLGDSVAFVTAPGEMFDRYNSNITWDSLKNKTQKEIYDILSAVNEWDKLLSANVGGSYGTPFVMGYANRHIGYMPNYIAYEYNQGSSFAAAGSYEVHCSELDKGENEHILDVFADMLSSMVNDGDSQLYQSGYCDVCEDDVTWETLSSRYNNGDTMASGHYRVTEDVQADVQKSLAPYSTACVDLNGRTVTGESRAFVLDDGETLNIMDSSKGKTGVVQGHGSSNLSGGVYFAGTLYIYEGATINLYSGTVTQVVDENHAVGRGGVVQAKGTLNIYGGTITGGHANWPSAVGYGGNIYVNGGTVNQYGGTVSNGTVVAGGNSYGGNIAITAVSHTDKQGNTYYTGEYNLYGGTVTGGSVAPVSDKGYGGNIYVNGGTFNQYGGTVSDGTVTAGGESDGGNIAIAAVSYDNQGNTYYTGEYNLYGGTVTGGSVAPVKTGNGYAGNIYVPRNARLNLYGGIVTGGTTTSGTGYGPCVYVTATGNIAMSGDAQVDQIRFNDADGNNLTISGLFTGSAEMRFGSATMTPGFVLGISDNAVIDTTDLTLYKSEYIMTVSGDKLVAGSAQTCECCAESAVINTLTQELWDAYEGNLPSAHYKLAEDISAEVAATGVETANQFCLDLNGYDISVTTGRLYKLLSGAHVRVGDSSADGSGVITTAGMPTSVAKGSRYGGLFYVDSGSTLDLSGGTMTMVQGDGMCVQRGAIVFVAGTFNMSGGTIRDGVCNGTDAACYGGNITISGGGVMNMSGGTVKDGTSNNGTTSENAGGNIMIFAQGTLNASGGTITGGTAKNDSVGHCIRQSSGGVLNLSGDAQIDETSLRVGGLKVTGTYTGSIALRIAGSTPASGLVIGVSDGADITGGTITVVDSNLSVKPSGNELVLSNPNGGAVIKDSTGGIIGTFGSVGEAINAYQGTNQTLMLIDDVNETGLTIGKDMTIDLNGRTFNQAITVDEGVTITCLDSQTADYDVSDESFTRVPASMAGNTAPAEGYVKYTHDDSTVSFHKIDTAVESLSVRPAKAGMYYGGTFKGDKYVAELVESFGVALSITQTPVADANGFPAHCKYSAFDGELFEPGNVEEYTSTILVNILSESNGTITNKRNGAMDVFGVTYIKLTDGTYVYGNRVSYSLQWAMEWTSANWISQSDEIKQAVYAMYEKYPAVFKAWETDTIIESYEAAQAEKEDKSLKVLLLGNSHGLDTTNLLMEVFETEGMGEYESVVLGAMYRSGCRMDQHHTFALNNSASYSYYKNVSGDGKDAWDITKDCTLLTALQDEKWDIVVFQEMNTTAGQADEFRDNDIAYVTNYICQKLGYKPELKWHLVWANPEIPSEEGNGYTYYLYDEQTRLEYIEARTGDEGPADGAENEGATDDDSGNVPWIYSIAKPTDHTINGVTYPSSLKWEYNYQNLYGGSRITMYQRMVDNVRDYVVGNSTYGIGEDDVIASGTAVQYAISHLGMTEQDMYRDYTHINDYGRVMTAYLWYAELMGIESISQVNYTTVTADMRQKKFVSKGDLVLNETQIQAIIDAVNYTLENTYGEY